MENSLNTSARTRYHLLDTLRGIMIVGVVIHHFIIDLNTFGFDVDAVLYSDVVENIIYIGQILFIMLSGLCCKLSRNNLRRGALCFGFAMLISLVTYIFIRDFFIYNGILHFLGLAMMLYAAVNALFSFFPAHNKPVSPLISCAGALSAMTLYCIFNNIYYCYEGLWLFGNIPLPNAAPYGTFWGYLIGFGGFSGTLSADYFPLLPWIFVFIAGAFLGNFFKDNKAPELFKKDLCKPVTFVGTHTLLVYILHQPIVFGLAYVLSLILL